MSRISVPEEGKVQVQVDREELCRLLLKLAYEKAELACFEVRPSDPFDIELPVISATVTFEVDDPERNSMQEARNRQLSRTAFDQYARAPWRTGRLDLKTWARHRGVHVDPIREGEVRIILWFKGKWSLTSHAFAIASFKEVRWTFQDLDVLPPCSICGDVHPGQQRETGRDPHNLHHYLPDPAAPLEDWHGQYRRD